MTMGSRHGESFAPLCRATRHNAAATTGCFRLMPCFFFDIDDTCSTLVDDEGLDLPDRRAAGRLALELLGEAIMIRADRLPQRIAVAVRDANGAVLHACAHLELTTPDDEAASAPH